MGVTHMEHVLVLTDQLERTRDFYRDIVGLAVGERPPLPFAGYWLYAGSTPCLHVAERRAYREHAATLGLEVDAGSAGAAAIDHIAFVATGFEELRARLEAGGTPAVENPVGGGGPRQLFLDDPNGIRIELSVREPDMQRWG
jgi:catechol 2,3-dioxygenase-like lactoylglutathione lyase family enzyme